MFDIGWSEILVIAAVAIIVVGPKELPKMLRTFGKTMGQVRRTANDFKRQFDDAIREAEREVDLSEAKKSIQGIGNPLADMKKDLEIKPATPRAIATPSTPAPAAAAQAHEAEPLKGGLTEADRGSDAA